jgi:hypothetical protein
MAEYLTVRAGSEDPLDFTLRYDSDGDGIADAPIDLMGSQRVTLFLKREDGTVISFTTTDPAPILAVTDAAAGQLKLSPAESTWANGDSFYAGYFLIIDGIGKDIPVPEGEEFYIIVRDQYVETP